MPDRPLVTSEASVPPSLTQNPDQPVTDKDEARLQDVDPAPAALTQDHLPAAQEEARLEDAPGPEAVEPSNPSETKQNLSWVAFYAYSELPTDPRPDGVIGRPAC